MRKITFVVASVAIGYVSVELLSFAVLFAVDKVKPSALVPTIDDGYFADLDDDELLSYFDAGYDAVLGWRHEPGSESTTRNCLGEFWTESFDAEGAREVPEEFDVYSISSYGDSYVKGGDVNNDETWQFQLAKRIGKGVKNYAVGAYDPYQALLRIKLHIEQGNIYPVTVLGINEQNISRVVNLYRPFMYRAARSKLSFKPGLSCSGDECLPVENLLGPDVRTIDAVQQAVLEARELDYWARTKPELAYPWSYNAFKLLQLGVVKLTSQEFEPLWLAPEGVAAMSYIVDDFRDAVRSAGSVPVVLFIPTKPVKDVPPSYRYFRDRIRSEYPDLPVIDVAEADFDSERFKLTPEGACHPSKYGHSVIADVMEAGLRGIIDGMAAGTEAAPAQK